jgi:sugar phosphate isomerase/epimerase
MTQLKPLEVGVMFWTGGELGAAASPDEIVHSVKTLGVSCGQLGVHGAADIGPSAQTAWKQALDRHSVTVVTVFAAYTGESYASIPTVRETVGFLPKALRREREERTLQVSDFARALGVSGLATHIGFIPEDAAHPDYITVRDMVGRVCDHCAKNGQTFALETGQEPAATLKQFIRDVARPNLGVNFDPANMVLYGSGEPLDALDTVKESVITVHCKDAIRSRAAGEWGVEKPLGQGEVGMDRFVAKLKEIGYHGPLTIEREITGEAQRADIREAIALLRRLSPTA